MFKLISGFCAALMAVAIFATGAEAQSGYKIQSGDTLQIEVLEDSSLNRSALVTPDGSVSFPLAGTVRARGRTVDQVAASLANGLASNFASTPNVFVSVAALREPVLGTGLPAAPPTTEIYVTGEITTPGRLDATPGVTILQAIAQAGGLTRFAAGKRIQLRRADKVYLYNYFANGGDKSIAGNTVLAPGDVIVVPQRRLFE
ncbi:MAG: polysaccharide biosynthesis/export family protein [Pseudomonadota bacterium]